MHKKFLWTSVCLAIVTLVTVVDSLTPTVAMLWEKEEGKLKQRLKACHHPGNCPSCNSAAYRLEKHRKVLKEEAAWAKWDGKDDKAKKLESKVKSLREQLVNFDAKKK